jgi:hypothetical protein
MQNFLIYRQKATENNMDIDPQYIKYSKKIILMVENVSICIKYLINLQYSHIKNDKF